MRRDIELLEMMKQALREPDSTIMGVAENVDRAKCICTIDAGGKKYPNASLRGGVITNDNGAVLFPKDKSVVLAIRLPQSNKLVVVACTEVDAVQIKIPDTEVYVDKQGVRIKRGSESLKSIISDTLDAILAMTVTTGVGPSGTPINFQQFQNLKSRLNNLLIQ